MKSYIFQSANFLQMTEEPGQENPAKPNGHTWIRWCTTIAIAAAIFFLATLVAQPARLVVDFPQVHRVSCKLQFHKY